MEMRRPLRRLGLASGRCLAARPRRRWKRLGGRGRGRPGDQRDGQDCADSRSLSLLGQGFRRLVTSQRTESAVRPHRSDERAFCGIEAVSSPRHRALPTSEEARRSAPTTPARRSRCRSRSTRSSEPGCSAPRPVSSAAYSSDHQARNRLALERLKLAEVAGARDARHRRRQTLDDRAPAGKQARPPDASSH